MKTIQHRLNYIFYLSLVLMLLSGSQSYARQFDQQYLAWKAQQEAQDARLKVPRVSESLNYYLSKPSLQLSNAAKINLNQANVVQLQELSGIGLKKAEAIIAYRQKNGKFQNIEQLQQVKGIGPALFAKNKQRLAL